MNLPAPERRHSGLALALAVFTAVFVIPVAGSVIALAVALS